MFNLFKKKPRERLTVSDQYSKNGPQRYVEQHIPEKDGKGDLTHIIGEEYPVRGLHNSTSGNLKVMEVLKSLFDKILASKLPSIIINDLPEEKMCVPVRELARVFDLMIEAEKLKGNKKRFQNYKKVFCFFMEGDTAWRPRIQWFLEHLDMSKIKLDEGDKYYFRAKNFRVDLEEEWKEALKAYPELKDKMKEFKQFVAEGWVGKDDDWRLESLQELAKRFLGK